MDFNIQNHAFKFGKKANAENGDFPLEEHAIDVTSDLKVLGQLPSMVEHF